MLINVEKELTFSNFNIILTKISKCCYLWIERF